MTSSETPLRSPWQTRQFQPAVRLAVTLTSIVLAIIGGTAAIVGLIVTGVSIVNGLAPNQTWFSVGVFAGSLLVVGTVSLIGAAKLLAVVSASASFTPHYGVVASDAVGHPFDVRFKRQVWARSLAGSGTVRFDADALVVEGHLLTHGLVQFGIFVAATALPFVLAGFRLGVIPALLLAYYVGRKRVSQSVAYTGITAVELRGRRVIFARVGAPGRVVLDVAASDGERFYRELQTRFPAAVTAAMTQPQQP